MKPRTIAAALAAFAPAAFAGLPTGLSGAWYDPGATGHGIHLEMLSGDSAIGAWNVFDAAGNPVHLYLQGRVEGDKLVMEAFAPRGMKFGSFDRSNYSAPRWGVVTLDFADCDSALMTYDGNGTAGAGYGQGSIALKRLTRIGGTSCALGLRPVDVPAGAYDGTWEWRGAAFSPDFRKVHAAVDGSGRFWATSVLTPGPTFVSSVTHPPVLIGQPPVATQDGFESAVTARYNSGATRGGGQSVPGAPVAMTVRYQATAGQAVRATLGSGALARMVSALEATRGPGANVLDDPGFDETSLDGRRFSFVSDEQFFDITRTIEFGGNYPNAGPDHICIVHNSSTQIPCEFSGRITATDAGLAMFDFTLTHSFDPGRSYRGKGWVRSDTGELVMVAEGDEKGLGLVATPKN